MSDLNLVEWDQKYSVGIKIIDDQHKELVAMTNELFAGCLQGDEAAREYFAQTIHKAVEYVRVHFSTEEQILQKIQYPQYNAHKKQHEDFIQEILGKVAAFERGEKFVPNNFARYLRDWVLEHIAVSDKLYGRYLQEKLQRQNAENPLA